MEDNKDKMTGLDFDLDAITSQVDKAKKETAEALDKIYVPVDDLEMNVSPLEEKAPSPAPEFEMTPDAAADKEAPAETGLVLEPSEREIYKEDAPAPKFDMKPTEPVEKKAPAPDFVMSPSEKKEASDSLEREFKSIDSTRMETASDAYDRAHDEAAGMKVEAAANATPSEVKAPEVRKVSLSSSAGTPSQAPAVNYERPAASQPSPAQAPVVNNAQMPSKHAKAQKPKKEKKYVSFGTLIGCMLLTLLLSTLLGSVLGGGFAKVFNGNSTDGDRPARDDSGLSQLNLSDATGSELTIAEIVDKNENAVVEIVVSGTTQGLFGQIQLTQGAGSGVIMTADGYIATNYHVIQGANKVEVTLRNGDVYPARIIGSDPDNDIAVIKIDGSGLTTAEVGDSSTIDVGDLAVAIGNPLGQLGGSVTTGIISALDRTLSVEGTTLTLLQTDAAINGGNSGGGLFNSRGQLIGIVESKASAVGVEGLGFALPINSVAGIINEMIEGGGNPAGQASGTPVVGIGIRDISEDEAEYYGMGEPGVYIIQVTGMNAMQAGFQEGDLIKSFNGTAIGTSDEFIALVKECKVGDTVTIVVSRDGREIKIDTVLEEKMEEY